MLEKDKLRKADIFSGSIICLLGVWIITQALKMPMKDSWGGVQNVWFVSPAIFPLLVGAVIMLLGALLTRTALKTVGFDEFRKLLRWLAGPALSGYLKTAANIRFYAIVVLLLSFIYLNIPRIDFFLCSVLFLAVFITMFYLDDELILKKLLFFYLAGTALFLVFFLLGFPQKLHAYLPYPGDWFMILFIFVFCIYSWMLIRNQPLLRKKYRTSLILAFLAPFLIGAIFKYLLLVPMPTEGLVVVVMDTIWYWEF